MTQRDSHGRFVSKPKSMAETVLEKPPRAPLKVNRFPEGEYDVLLDAVGESKIRVIKEIRALTVFDLKGAKDLTDMVGQGVRRCVLARVDEETASRAKAQLEAAGATVVVQGPSVALAPAPDFSSFYDDMRARMSYLNFAARRQELVTTAGASTGFKRSPRTDILIAVVVGWLLATLFFVLVLWCKG